MNTCNTRVIQACLQDSSAHEYISILLPYFDQMLLMNGCQAFKGSSLELFVHLHRQCIINDIDTC